MQHDIRAEDHGPLGDAMAGAVGKCVHCGFCLAACPTYQELGQETDTPRGRIVLMKEVLEGNLSLDDAQPHLDTCLGCLACEPACPSGVPYRDLISPFRAIHETRRKRTLIDRLRRRITQSTLPYPKRFRLAAKTGGWARLFAPLVPKPFRVMLDLLPPRLPPAESWAKIHPATGTRRGRVALLTGCAQSVLDPDINTATIDVLTRNGVEVVVPPSQVCCGALSWHVGNQKQAAKFARQNMRAFSGEGTSGPVDAILTNAAGCGSGMHEYNLILKGTDDESSAEAFRHRVQDVSVYLDSLGDLETFPDPGREVVVAYHDACHLANAQGVRRQPRVLLKKIPGVTLKEISGADMCCGSAGTYNIDQPEIAASLGAQKATNVMATAAEVVASGNIGCLTQLRGHLERQASPIRVRHTMQILRDAYAGRL